MLRRTWLPLLLLAALLAPSAAAGSGLVENPSDPRSFTWAEEGVLAVGGGGLTKDQVDWLFDQGFRAIASFRAEHQDPADYIRAKGMAFLYIPVDHAVNMNLSQLQRFVAWAKEQEAAGRPMYIHCTNGWHRAAAFATAWEMERDGTRFDETTDEVMARRPGSVMRAPAPLLEYDALLAGKPGLTVILQAARTRPERDGTMPVTVEVLAEGVPLADARVEVWSEESRLGFTGKTDAEGRFAFTYKGSVGKSSVDHLYARASAPGYVDGADNVELFYVVPVNPGPLQVEATWTPRGIDVDVRKHGIHAVSHVIATGPGGWSWVERSSGGEVLVPLPPTAGPVTIRAERWGADPAKVVVDAKPSATQPPPAKAEPTPPPKASPPPGFDPDEHRGAIRAKDAPPEPNRAPLPESLRTPIDVPDAGPASPGPDARPESVSQRTSWVAVATGGLMLVGATALMLRKRTMA